jgi:hypothetical protein
MANLQYKQDVLGGIVVGVDPLDMSAEMTPDCCNVDISKPGQMSSAEGIEKQRTTAYAGAIVGIHQLENDATLVEVS